MPSSSVTSARRCGTSAACGGAWSSVPVIRRCTRSARPDSNRTIRYLPRRSTATTRSPTSSAATSSGSSGRVEPRRRRSRRARTCGPRAPAPDGAGPSRPRAARARARLARPSYRAPSSRTSSRTRRCEASSPISYAASTSADGLVCRSRLVARVHLGEHVARARPRRRASRGRRRRPRGRSRPPSCAGPRRGGARRGRSGSRRAARRSPARGASTSRTTGSARQRRRVGIAALRPDPALVRPRARSRPRPPPRRGAGPRPRRSPRSENASMRAHASSTSSVKSGGPSPRTVSRASRISSAFPTAAPSG